MRRLPSPALTPIVHLVVGARPNYMKIAPLYRVLESSSWCTPLLVDTGQHSDPPLSASLRAALGLPEPAIALGPGGGRHGEQTARILAAYEQCCVERRPAWTVVAGDVDSTLAAALAAAKLGIPVAHVEAGLRSGDRSMPEELNRLLTDALADLLWAPSADAVANLRREGIPDERIDLVGNLMIDTFELLRPEADAATTVSSLGLEPGGFAVVTLHRPSNVDDPDRLAEGVHALVTLASKMAVVFPVHPRARQALETAGLLQLLEQADDVTVLPPLGYVEFISLLRAARVVVTDSGGVQEEATYARIPCVTVRDTTERPVTVEQGTNRLSPSWSDLPAAVVAAIAHGGGALEPPPLWDGQAATRAADSLRRRLTDD